MRGVYIDELKIAKYLGEGDYKSAITYLVKEYLDSSVGNVSDSELNKTVELVLRKMSEISENEEHILSYLLTGIKDCSEDIDRFIFVCYVEMKCIEKGLNFEELYKNYRELDD